MTGGRSITVVIPAYNEERYIERTLQSLRKQDYQNYRITVVDNNSKDGTIEIAKKYADNVLTENRQGAGYARYHGIEDASSDIIASADADAIYPPNWLSKINEALQGDVVGCYGRINSGHRIYDQLYHYFVRLNVFIGFPQCAANNLAFIRKYYEGFNTKCHSGEDIMLAFHLKKFGRFVYRQDITADVSDRRIKASVLKLLWENGKNYFSLLLFKRPACDISNYR